MSDQADNYRAYREAVDQRDAVSEMEALAGVGTGASQPTIPSAGATGDEAGGRAGGSGAVTLAPSPASSQTDVQKSNAGAEANDRSVLSRAGDVVADVATGMREAVPQALGGFADAMANTARFSAEAIQSIGESMPDLMRTIWFAGSPYGALSEEEKDGLQAWADEMAAEANVPSVNVRELINTAPANLAESFPTVDDPESVTGAGIRAVSNFVSAFIPVNQMAKGAGVQRVASEVLAGGIAAGVALDPTEGRLSTMLNEVPGLAAVVPDYLADVDPANESQWENRMRSAIEEAGLAGFGTVLLQTFKAYKAMRADGAASDQGALDRMAADEAVRESSAEITQPVTEDMLAGLGDSSDNAPILIRSETEDNAAEAFRKDRAARATMEIAGNLPDGFSVKQLKGGVGIYNKAGKRVGTVKVPEQIEDKFLKDISRRVEQVNGLEVVQGAIDAAKSLRPQADSFDELLDAVRNGVKTPGVKLPVLGELKRLGGVAPGSELAEELKALGVTNKTLPGLFRKEGGLTSADTIEADLDFFQGRFDPSETGGDFVPVETVLEGVRSELSGNPFRSPEIQDQFDALTAAVADMQQGLDDLGVDISEIDNATARRLINEKTDELARFEATLEGPALEEAVPMTGDDLDAVPLASEASDGIPAKHQGKVYLNLARMRTPDDVKLALAEMAELDADAINAKTGGRQTDAQVQRLAQQEFQNVEDLIGRPPGPMSAAQAVAARKLLVASGEQLVALAQRAKQADAGKADQYAFRRAMSIHYAIQSEVIAARKETARALRSWSIPAGNDKTRSQMIDELMTRAGGPNELIKQATAIASLADNPTGLNHVIDKTMKGKIGRAFYETWINGLLSSPKTHMVNITSNTLTSLWAIPERALAATYSQVLGDGSVQYGEAAALAYGWTKGVRDGFLLVAKGEKAADLEGVADLFQEFGKVEGNFDRAITGKAFEKEGAFGTAIDYLGNAVNLPTTLLGKEDQFFKAIGYRMELQSRAYRTAAGEGLEGEAMAKRMAEILNNPPQDLVADALDAAHYQTFTNALGPTGNMGMAFLNRVPAARFVVPFIRTPTNILKYTFERTPLAFASSRIRADIAAGGPRRAQAMARVTLGSMAMLTFADMASDGVITGAGPSHPEVRKAWLRTHQPYSIKVGDQWVQYNRLDPIGMMLGMGADIQEIITYGGSDEETGRVITAGATAFAQNLANKTYLSGIYEFIAAVNPRDPTSNPADFLQGFAGSLIPFSSLARGVAQADDPVLRDTRVIEGGETMLGEGAPAFMAEFLQGMVNNAKAGIPSLSADLPAKRNLWGEIRTRESELGQAYDFISPMRVQSTNDDPLDHLLIANRIRIAMPGRSMEGVPLTAEEYWRFVELAGAPAKEALDVVITTPGFQGASNGPEGMKSVIIKDVVQQHRRAAVKRLKIEFSGLRERINKERLRLNEQMLGTGG